MGLQIGTIKNHFPASMALALELLDLSFLPSSSNTGQICSASTSSTVYRFLPILHQVTMCCLSAGTVSRHLRSGITVQMLPSHPHPRLLCDLIISQSLVQHQA